MIFLHSIGSAFAETAEAIRRQRQAHTDQMDALRYQLEANRLQFERLKRERDPNTIDLEPGSYRDEAPGPLTDPRALSEERER